MKPLHVGLLVAAGALGGALIMYKAAPHATPPVAAVAQAPASAPAAEAAQPSEAERPIAEPLPSPFPEKNETPAVEPRPKHVAKSHRPVKKAQPVSVARNEPPAVQPAAPAPEPVKETPPPQPSEPAPEVKAEPAPAPPPPPPPARVTLQAGTLIPVRLIEGLSSDRNSPGDTFTVTLTEPLAADGFVIAERGARAYGRVVEAHPAGRVKGVSGLVIELTQINTSDGQKVKVQTDSFTKEGERSVGKDAAKVGAAAGIGAAIGAIAGGGKGAGIGAAIGGAAGAGGVMATRGEASVLRSETRLSFRLREPVMVTERQ